MTQRIGIIGSSSAIGKALVTRLISANKDAEIHTFSSRSNGAAPGATHHIIQYTDEKSLHDAAHNAAENGPFDLCVVATGMLHNTAEDISPEKSLRDLSAHKFEALFAANTIFPAISAKHFIPLMQQKSKSVFAILTARVGSISDNHAGGWYAYRSSKAALNMIIKNAAIEMARKHKDLVILGLHPGTVDTALSKPFQGGVQHAIFTPDQAATYLLDVIKNAQPLDSGKCFSWDGQEIDP